MPLEYVPDGNGNTIKLISCNGRYYSPMFSEEALSNIKNFPLRDDDVLLCSYAKSGCHWVWEIIRILLAGEINPENSDVEKESCMMEWRPHQEYASLPSPRVLNNHFVFEGQPNDLLVKKPKTVFYYRNYKDVAVSFYHHHKNLQRYEYNGDFSSYVQMLVGGRIENGSPFEYIKSWEKGIAEHPELPVFVGSYEDLKENNFSEVKRLCKFLDKDYSDDFLHQVCSRTDFTKMKEIKGEKSVKNKEGDPVMYRKGQVGDWKNYFTVSLNDWFDGVIKRETLGSKLNFRYTL